MDKKFVFATLFSGSSGNSTYIRSGNTEILIDAGRSAKFIEARLNELGTSLGNIKAIFITHEHSDHTSALAVINKKHHIKVFSPKGCRSVLNEICDDIEYFESPYQYDLGDIKVSSFETPHDSLDSAGYVVDLGEFSVAVATDMGCIMKNVVEAVAGVRYAVVEANYDEEMLLQGIYPDYLKHRILSDHGHLSNENAAILASVLLRTGTEKIAFGHLSKENNTPEHVEEAMREEKLKNDVPGEYIVAERDGITVIAEEAAAC